MTFDYPFILIGFTIFIPIIILDIINRKKRAMLADNLVKRLNFSLLFFRLFLVFAIAALAGPRWGTGYAPAEYRRGLDTVFAIDVSRSMDIQDAQTPNLLQSRLERGISIASETISSVAGARFAAAIGRAKGYLAVPLTHDNEAALVFLESLDGSSMTGRSTNLESLIEAAAGAFQSASAARKVIVLISDGESHSGVMRNAVNMCARNGIIINTVAVGSDEGRRIAEHANLEGSPLVISRRDSAVMRTTAERTGGIYIDGSREDAALLLGSHLLSIARDIKPGSGRKESKQRRALFIMLAIAAYAASKFVTRQSGKNTFNQKQNLKKPVAHVLPFAFITVLLFVFSSCSEGKILLIEANYLHSRNRHEEAAVPYLKALNHEDSAPYAEYGLGLTYYLLEQEEEALKKYGNSQKLIGVSDDNEHRELRYRNYYNSGIILFEREEYHLAAASFREALKTDPKRIEAKRNLELSLLSILMESKKENNTDQQQEQREILFDYLREEEQQKWKSSEWNPEENNTGSDY
ncbi:MAG: VWA domain-containing protein [Treponema sp.]|nr:VWA domain-containing protein [Treponema sp.]